MGKVGEVLGMEGGVTAAAVLVREYDEKRDKWKVEQVENQCDVGPRGKLCLHTGLMGDPICRVRHAPSYLMLVAEMAEVGCAGGVDKERREIVGMIKGCIKTVTCGNRLY